MTALTVPARPEQDTSPRPVPWRRMAWVTWRQHRAALAGVAVFLGAVAVCLWLAGLQLHHAYAAATACRPVSSIACAGPGGPADRFNGMYGFLANGFVLQAVPALIGAFAGAPVLARELETGTFRYAWTQGFGRSPFYPGLFDLRGVGFAAWALAAFAIGALAGMLIRRVVPAMVATLAVYAGLAFAAGGFLRQHYLTPLVTSNPNVPASAWIMSQWGTKGGKFAWTGGLPPMNLLLPNCPPPGPPGVRVPKPSVEAILQCLPHHGYGYTQWTSYQPASRFWPFQWIEGGWLLALSVLLIAVTVWLVRRRVA
jgi:hypothetical protein